MDKIYFGGVKMFDKNLKYLRNKFNMEQIDLAHRLGRKSSSSVSEWETGKYTPKIKTLAEIAQIFKVDLDDLMNADLSQMETSLVDKIADISSQLHEVRQQKVYNLAERELEEQRYIQDYDDYVGQTAAGAPIEGQQPIPFVGSKTVNLLVNGDSMEPEFYDGDIIKYHPQPELENGEIGVFAVNGGITMKKFRRNSDIRLESLNKKYEDIVIKETDDFSILGKVII